MRSSADCSETSAIMSLLNLLLAPSNLDISDLKIDISERSRSESLKLFRIQMIHNIMLFVVFILIPKI